MAYTAAEMEKMSYNEMKLRFSRGDITEAEMRKAYQAVRKKAQNAINRIKKSDVAFTERVEPITRAGKKTGDVKTRTGAPKFDPVSKIDSGADLLKAFADVNRWLASGDHTITQRREKQREQLKTLHQHGFDFVNNENIGLWGQFQEWFRATGLDIMYGSGADVITEFFQEYQEDLDDSRPQYWEELFEEYVESRI